MNEKFENIYDTLSILNTIAKSIRSLSKITSLALDMKNGKISIDTTSYIYKEARDYVCFYDGLKKLKATGMMSDIFALKDLINNISENKKGIFYNMLINTNGATDYIHLHSKFDEDSGEDDWVVDFFKKFIAHTPKPKKNQPPPDSVLKLLSAFNPVGVDYEKDNKEIYYGLWSKLPNNRIRDPIHLVDLNWEKVKGVKIVDVSNVLRNVEVIDMSKYTKKQ